MGDSKRGQKERDLEEPTRINQKKGRKEIIFEERKESLKEKRRLEFVNQNFEDYLHGLFGHREAHFTASSI